LLTTESPVVSLKKLEEEFRAHEIDPEKSEIEQMENVIMKLKREAHFKERMDLYN